MPHLSAEELDTLFTQNPDLAEKNRRIGAAIPAPPVSPTAPEKDFQARLIKELQKNGWRVCEFRKARIKKDGVDVYRTPFGADGKGFPDLIAGRPPRILFIENKGLTGDASPEQIRWLLLLGKCPVEVYCWTPEDWDEIMKVIQKEEV